MFLSGSDGHGTVGEHSFSIPSAAVPQRDNALLLYTPSIRGTIMRIYFQLIWCVLFLNTFIFQINAQYGSGTIIGTVTDPTVATVPGATITIKNQETSASRTARTDADGNYRFNAVPPGRYTATANAPSFKVTNIPDVTVTVNTETRVDFSMQVGAVSETVNVQAVTPVLQTDSASLGTAIDTRTVHELPLNARNFFDLVALTPGATKVAGGSSVMDGRSVQVGGIRNTSTLTTLDGTDFTVANVNNPAIALSLDGELVKQQIEQD